MATVNEIYQIIDQYAPVATQMGFDNAGFLVGITSKDYHARLNEADTVYPFVAFR